MKLTLIGAGNMGMAMVHAWIQSSLLSHNEIHLIERNPEKQQELKAQHFVSVTSELSDQIKETPIVMIAIKPQGIQSLMQELKAWLSPEQTIVSVLAGTSTQTLSEGLQHASIIRVMPNTPSQIQKGMLGYYSTPDVSHTSKQTIESLLQATGQVLEVLEEQQLDAITAVSGSGPGYVFYFAEHLVQTAKQLGFSEEDATLLVQQTLLGSIELWKDTQKPVSSLRQQVTSPGGTTEAALKHFQSHQLGKIIQEGMQACHKRAQELSKHS